MSGRADLVRRLAAYGAAKRAIETALRIEGEMEHHLNGAVPTWRMGFARVSGSETRDHVEVTDSAKFLAYLAGAYPTEVQTISVQVVRNPEWLSQVKDTLARISREEYNQAPPGQRPDQPPVIDVQGTVVPGAVFVPGGRYVTTSTTLTATAKRRADEAAKKGVLEGDWSHLDALIRGDVPLE